MPFAERLYPFSGVESRIANIPNLLSLQFEQQFAETALSETGKSTFKKMSLAFAPDSMRKDAKTWFSTNIKSDFAAAVDTWLTDSKTRSIHVLLNRPLDENLVTLLESHFDNEANVPGEERIKRLIKLDERMRTSEVEAMVIVNVYLSFVTVMNPYLPQEERISEEDMPEIAHLMHTDLYQAYQGANLGRLAYLLRDVSDADLQKFSDAYASPSGMWFADLGKSTTEYVLERIGQRIDSNL